MIVTFRYRVKSKVGMLNKQSRAVNFVWNYCNDRQKDSLRLQRKWLTAFDLNNLTAGSAKLLGLHSGTINAVCEKYVKSRSQRHRPYLRYRGKKNLGWIPIKATSLRYDGGSFVFMKERFSVFLSRPLPQGKIKDGGSFSQDSKGNWYINVSIDVASPEKRLPLKGIGIDLGLKDFATTSEGEKVEAKKFYRLQEVALAVAQRASKRKRVKSIHLKIARKRSDFHHKLSSRLIGYFDVVVVGDVGSSGLAKTKLAKSVLDAGWSSFRNMLAYKAIKHGAWYSEVNERFTTQTCSACGELPESRPKGIAGLGIREWACSECGANHDRDTNAAINILRRGHATLAEGNPEYKRMDANLGYGRIRQIV